MSTIDHNNSLSTIVEGLSPSTGWFQSERRLGYENGAFKVLKGKEIADSNAEKSLEKIGNRIVEFVKGHQEAKTEIKDAITKRIKSLKGRVTWFTKWFMSKSTIDKIDGAVKALQDLQSKIDESKPQPPVHPLMQELEKKLKREENREEDSSSSSRNEEFTGTIARGMSMGSPPPPPPTTPMLAGGSPPPPPPPLISGDDTDTPQEISGGLAGIAGGLAKLKKAKKQEPMTNKQKVEDYAQRVLEKESKTIGGGLASAQHKLEELNENLMGCIEVWKKAKQEIRDAQNKLQQLPENKTPAQIMQEVELNEQILTSQKQISSIFDEISKKLDELQIKAPESKTIEDYEKLLQSICKDIDEAKRNLKHVKASDVQAKRNIGEKDPRSAKLLGIKQAAKYHVKVLREPGIVQRELEGEQATLASNCLKFLKESEKDYAATKKLLDDVTKKIENFDAEMTQKAKAHLKKATQELEDLVKQGDSKKIGFKKPGKEEKETVEQILNNYERKLAEVEAQIK